MCFKSTGLVRVEFYEFCDFLLVEDIWRSFILDFESLALFNETVKHRTRS